MHVALGWRCVFGMLVVLGVGAAAGLTSLLLPETHPPAKRSQFHPVVAGEQLPGSVATQPAFLLLAVSARRWPWHRCSSTSARRPAIILEHWHLSKRSSTTCSFPIVLGLMSAPRSPAGRIAGRVQRATQLKIGFGMLAASPRWSASVAHLFVPQLPILVVQLFLFVLASGAQLTYPVLSLEMIDMFPRARGAAASVQTFIALGVGAVVDGLIAPMLHGNLALPGAGSRWPAA